MVNGPGNRSQDNELKCTITNEAGLRGRLQSKHSDLYPPFSHFVNFIPIFNFFLALHSS